MTRKADKIYAQLWGQQERDYELQKLAQFDLTQKNEYIRAKQAEQDLEEVDVTFEKQNGRTMVVTRECKKGSDKIGSLKEAIKRTIQDLKERQGR